MYINNFIVVGFKDAMPVLNWVKNELKQEYKIKDLGECIYYLGIEIH